MPRPDPNHWTQIRRRRVRPDDLVASLGFRRPPVPIFDVARALGVKVSSDTSKHWSGAAEFDVGSGQATIWYNRDEAQVRQRFTVAHELGHILLHPDGLVYRDARFDGSDKQEESQANRFAAALLMPDWLMDEVVPAYKYKADVLAMVLQVSQQALSIRLRVLYGV